MQGSFLIAHPFLNDLFFKRSVIFLSEHNDQGSLGFVMNRPSGLMIKDLFPHIRNGNFPVYEGGPVSKSNLYYIHSLGMKLSDSLLIRDGLYWGGNFFELVHLIEHNEIRPHEIRFFVGYAGWAENQLEDEIKEQSWFVRPANLSLLLHNNPDNLWAEELRQVKDSYKVFTDFAFDPSLN